jgi:hypothetical protein
MDAGTLGSREIEARNRVLEASQKLASKLHIDAALLELLNRSNRDPRVKALFQLEAIADILEAINDAVLPPAEPKKRGK